MVYDCFNHIRPFSIDKMGNHPFVHLVAMENHHHVYHRTKVWAIFHAIFHSHVKNNQRVT